jgi:peptide/nickel transport system permease protein
MLTEQLRPEQPMVSARLYGGLVGRRMIVAVLLLTVVSFGTFLLIHIAPGNTVRILLGTQASTPALIHHLEAEYHLNQPFFVQYWSYLRGAMHFDFGHSIATSQPVSEMIGSAAPITIFLGVYAFVVTLVVGVALGMLAAVRQRTAVDRGVVGLAVFGVSAPAFATGFLLLYLFSVKLDWFPIYGAGSGFGDRLWHFTLPAVALAVSGGALVVKLTRAGMIGALEQDFVTFARARGLSQRRVLLGYALRNALVPVISSGGIILAYVLTGAVLVEVTFNIPGLGSMLVSAVNAKDIPVIQGVALLFAAMIIFVNLLTDLLYMAVDPRIRLGRSQAS